MTESSRSSTNRAANLRSQRAVRTKDKANHASDRVRSQSSATPVMSRSGMAGTAPNRRQQPNARKKYYYTLNTPGAEVRLPALPVIRFGWRSLSGAIAIILTIAIWAIWNSPFFQVDKINVNGVKRIPLADITTALNIQGETILNAIPVDMEKNLIASFPDLASASVQVGLPASVVVKVTERVPVIAWKTDGQTTWIDSQGFSFPVRGDAANLVVVQAQGALPSPAVSTDKTVKAEATSTPSDKAKAAQPFLTADMETAILKLSKQAPANTPILYDTKYGLGWNDPRGWKVYFGTSVDNMDLKLAQCKTIVDELSQQGVHPVMISVEFPHAPFYRLEP